MVRHELVTALASGVIELVPTLVENLKWEDVATNKLPSELRPLFEVGTAAKSPKAAGKMHAPPDRRDSRGRRSVGGARLAYAAAQRGCNAAAHRRTRAHASSAERADRGTAPYCKN